MNIKRTITTGAIIASALSSCIGKDSKISLTSTPESTRPSEEVTIDQAFYICHNLILNGTQAFIPTTTLFKSEADKDPTYLSYFEGKGFFWLINNGGITDREGKPIKAPYLLVQYTKDAGFDVHVPKSDTEVGKVTCMSPRYGIES